MTILLYILGALLIFYIFCCIVTIIGNARGIGSIYKKIGIKLLEEGRGDLLK